MTEVAESEAVAPSSPKKDEPVESAEDTNNDNDPASAAVPTNPAEEKTKPDVETETAGTADSVAPEEKTEPKPIVSSSKRNRPAYKYDPSKITLRFLFANRDGLTVTVACEPSDTVGEVKGALLSVWPEDLPSTKGGDRLRLICMGKGFLMPDTRTLKESEIPVFKTHPTPINVSILPETGKDSKPNKKKKEPATNNIAGGRSTTTSGSASASSTPQADQGCSCIIL